MSTSTTWTSALPDGAVSVEGDGEALLLKASNALQERFEALIERKKSALLTESEAEEYEAICELDNALSWINRLARKSG